MMCSHCGQILDNGLKTIARLSQLKVLNMTGMLKISPVGIEDVCKSSPQLTAIYVGGCKQLTKYVFLEFSDQFIYFRMQRSSYFNFKSLQALEHFGYFFPRSNYVSQL